jgi:hypothetical protein
MIAPCNTGLVQRQPGRKVMRVTYYGGHAALRFCHDQNEPNMHTPNNVEVSPIQLSDKELATVAGGMTEVTQLMQAISDEMKKIQDTAKNAVSNIR